MQTVGGAALSGHDNSGPAGTAGAVLAGAPVTRPTAARRAVGLLVTSALAALVIDQLTKHAALAALEDRDPVRLLGGAVYLTLTRNSGAAFSLGSGYTFVFPLITLVVIGWIAVMARRLRSVPWALSLGLVLGGALGNLTDRLFRAPGPFVGHVIDMVSLFDPFGRVWPVFNVADSCLVVGVALAVLLELTGRQRDGSRLQRPASPGANPAGPETDGSGPVGGSGPGGGSGGVDGTGPDRR